MYVANKEKTFDASRDLARSTIDSYPKGIGATVDADIGEQMGIQRAQILTMAGDRQHVPQAGQQGAAGSGSVG